MVLCGLSNKISKKDPLCITIRHYEDKRSKTFKCNSNEMHNTNVD